MGLRGWIGDAQPCVSIAITDSTESAEPLAFVVLIKMNDKAALDAITGHMGLEEFPGQIDGPAVSRSDLYPVFPGFVEQQDLVRGQY